MYVDINQVVSFSKTIVKTADNMDTNIWKEWIYTGALLHLGVSDDEIDVAEIIPNNFIAPLPTHCRRILNLSLFDTAGNQMRHKFRAGKQRIFLDNRLASTAIGSTENINTSIPVDVSNDRYNIILGTNGENVGKILIRYFKYPLDGNDQPLIREEDILACALFIKYMQALRDDDNQSKILNYKNAWEKAADSAKAQKRMESVTPEIANTIVRDMTRLIPQFNTNSF